jgi:hypothetical protein
MFVRKIIQMPRVNRKKRIALILIGISIRQSFNKELKQADISLNIKFQNTYQLNCGNYCLVNSIV